MKTWLSRSRRVKRAAAANVGGAHAKCAIAGLDGSVGALADAHAGLDGRDDAGGVVTLAVIAHHAAQQRVDGHAVHLTLDVPERQIERAEGVHLFASRRIEERARHVLPEPFDVMRILADQPPGALFQRVLGPAFTNAHNAGVGLHRHHHVALIEQRVEIGRRVDAYPGDLHFGHRCSGGSLKGGSRGHAHCGRREKRSSIHI